MWARVQDGQTALMKASAKGHAECARLLLDAGADKEAKANVRASAGGGSFGIWHLALVEMDWCLRRPVVCI